MHPLQEISIRVLLPLGINIEYFYYWTYKQTNLFFEESELWSTSIASLIHSWPSTGTVSITVKPPGCIQHNRRFQVNDWTPFFFYRIINILGNTLNNLICCQTKLKCLMKTNWSYTNTKIQLHSHFAKRKNTGNENMTGKLTGNVVQVNILTGKNV